MPLSWKSPFIRTVVVFHYLLKSPIVNHLCQMVQQFLPLILKLMHSRLVVSLIKIHNFSFLSVIAESICHWIVGKHGGLTLRFHLTFPALRTVNFICLWNPSWCTLQIHIRWAKISEKSRFPVFLLWLFLCEVVCIFVARFSLTRTAVTLGFMCLQNRFNLWLNS